MVNSSIAGDEDRALRHRVMETLKPLSFLWGSAGLAVVVGALGQILFARQLGPAGYGVIVTANSIANLLGPFAALGVGLMLMQKYGREGWAALRWVAPSLRLYGACTFIAFVLFLAWALTAMDTPAERLAAALLLPLVAAFGAIQLAESRFQLEHRFFHVARWQLTKHASIFVVAAATLAGGWSLLGASVGLFVISALVAGYAFWAGAGMMRAEFDLKGHEAKPTKEVGERPSYKTIFLEAWPFAATSFGFLLFFQSSIAVVQALAGTHTAGVYGLAVSIMTAAYLLPRILYRKFFLAKVSRWHFHDRGKVQAFVHRLVPAVALMSIPLAALIALAAPALVHRIFGAEFAATVPVLQVLAIALPLRFLSSGLAVAAVETGDVRERVFW
ncbi:MAG TPA: oligosaccharide flippase family protein, partial [Candidatus Binatia bacterium]|nr:oligosaccharide flippase family protein [Candidatus Binatia bacterium]